jgi:hypothetical protein
VRIANVLFTFHLALFAWIFFRASSVHDAFSVIGKIAGGGYNFAAFKESILFFAVNPKYTGSIFFVMAMCIVFLIIDPKMDNLVKGRWTITFPAIRYAIYSLILACVILFGFFGDVQFIYFQF